MAGSWKGLKERFFKRIKPNLLSYINQGIPTQELNRVGALVMQKKGESVAVFVSERVSSSASSQPSFAFPIVKHFVALTRLSGDFVPLQE